MIKKGMVKKEKIVQFESEIYIVKPNRIRQTGKHKRQIKTTKMPYRVKGTNAEYTIVDDLEIYEGVEDY